MQLNYHNFWKAPADDIWFTHFIKAHFSHLKYEKTLQICSVFGSAQLLKQVPHPKLFFSGENVHSHPLMPNLKQEYSHYCLDQMDLSLGYDELDVINYLRFPLWICYLTKPINGFNAFTRLSDLKQIIEYHNNVLNRINYRPKFAAQISRHDANGIRQAMVNALNNLERVECAGVFLQNTDELQTKFNDDKLAYLRQFRFNICPENASEYGYVTEKPFEAIQAGCIPIYWGNKDLPPEPDVLNPNAIIQVNSQHPQAAFDLISELYNNPKAYREFIEQKPFKPEAAEWIWEKLTDLKIRLQEILRQY